jgi:hypothetical protein
MSVQKNLTSVEKAKAAGRMIVAKLPEAAIRGFDDGRVAGHDFVESVPYAAGAAVGFSYGASESILGLLAAPVTSLVGWAAWAIGCGNRGQSENHDAAEVA